MRWRGRSRRVRVAATATSHGQSSAGTARRSPLLAVPEARPRVRATGSGVRSSCLLFVKCDTHASQKSSTTALHLLAVRCRLGTTASLQQPWETASTSYNQTEKKEKEIVLAKKELHPALKANADRLKRGEPLFTKKQTQQRKAPAAARPKIRSKRSGSNRGG